MTRTLIFGSSYVDSDLKLETARLWARMVDHLNPGIDVCVIDSASPRDIAAVVPSRFQVHRFEDNIGPISRGYRDGAGRALCKGLELAVAGGYDYACHWECDLLFVKPIQDVVFRMETGAVCAAALYQPQYRFLEFGLSVFATEWLVRSKFVKRYDWANAPFYPIPEIRIEHLCGDDLWLLPYHGIRNDQGQVNVMNLAHLYPYGPPSWLHHCNDMSLWHRFLDINQIVLP